MKDPEVDAAYEYPYQYNNRDSNRVETDSNGNIGRGGSFRGNNGMNGSVVFVDHYEDFLPVLVDLVGVREQERAAIERRAYDHYHNGIAKNLDSLDRATQYAIRAMYV